MDWRKHCRDTLHESSMKDRIRSWIDQYAPGDSSIVDTMSAGGIVSFPHTTLDYSGDMTTRVVTSLYASGVERVVALGVIHAGAMSEQYKGLFAELLSSQTDPAIRRARLDTFGGAFVRSQEETAFGRIAAITPVDAWSRTRVSDDLLAGEFCLDWFLAILLLAAERLKRAPLAVLPMYVGASFDPTTGEFDLASEIAADVEMLRDKKTAIVVTGDLVHYGTTYSSPEEMEGNPSTIEGLKKHFLPLVEKSLRLITQKKDYLAAFDLLNAKLHNDQRFLLPVVGELLGEDASFGIMEFHLSDYSPIWEVRPPCVVASSLVTFTPGKAEPRPDIKGG